MIFDFNALKNEEIYKYAPSESGELVIYLTQKNALEEYYYHLINSNGEKIKDSIDNIYAFLCWDKDIGFYYTKKIYIGGDIVNYTSYRYEIYYHKVGDIQENDKKFLNKEESEFDNKAFVDMSLSDDSKYSILMNNHDEKENFLIIKNNISGKILKVYRYQNYNMYADIINDKLLIYTNKNNEFGEIKVVDIKDLNDKTKIKSLIKPEQYLLEDCAYSKDYIYCVYLKDASHFIKIYDYKGNFIRDIKFDIKKIVRLSLDNISP